ncbi:MAG: glucose-6-phosphate isomerase [Pseudomonadota bacterium]
MLKFDFANCKSDAVGFEHGITPHDLKNIKPRVISAHKQLKNWQGTQDAIFLDHPFEPGLAEKFRKAGEQVQHSFDNLVVLGIGGSALGLRCLANACLNSQHNLLDRKQRKNAPKLFVCDNIDPDSFGSLLETLNLKETCFNVISKSGGTTETMAQFSYLLPILKTKFGSKWKDHVFVTTDPARGLLRKFVTQEGVRSFEVPPKLGGRYSVLSSVGLFPAACLGLDVESILDGAMDIVKICQDEELETNPAYYHAVISHIMLEIKKKNISVLMPYADHLALFADWYVQLFAESLGKEGQGMTPVKAIGSTDQHSQIQLYMDGPNDKLITFVGVEKFKKNNVITHPLESFDYIKGYGLGDILIASQHATTKALTVAKRPNITITLHEVTPRAMGQLFMFFEISTAFIGALAQINPFDQPGVELGKKLLKEILSNK